MKKAGDILKSVLGDAEAQQAREWSSFFGGWSIIAGEDLAAHSKVIDVKKGTVLVEVDHPGWMQVLQLKATRILKAIKSKYPELDVEDIRCFLQSEQPDPPDQTPKNGRPSPAPFDENTEEYREFKVLLDRLRKNAKSG